MPLKNYTTEISAMKSIGEIQGKLVGHGAEAILLHYGPDREPESLTFSIPTVQGNISFRLPANILAVRQLLVKSWDPDYRKYDKDYQIQRLEKVKQQASKVAWRIIKDWVDAQLAIIETEMVTIEQVFLPYMLVKGGRNTLYEMMVESSFQLPEGRG